MDLVNFLANERVDLPDFLQATQAVPLALQYELVGGFLIPEGEPTIVTGFDCVASNGMLHVNAGPTGSGSSNGSAFLAWRDGTGEVRYGLVMAHNQSPQHFNISSYAVGTYGVWVRFQFVPGVAQNRAFYSPNNNGHEYPGLVQTRLQATWDLRVEYGSPGREWIQLAELQITSSTQTIVDKRKLYFEGCASTTPAFAPQWGSADDRTTDRNGDKGIKDLRTMLDALRQCIVDLKGPSGTALQPWWSPRIGGMNIGAGFTTQASSDARVAIGGNGNFFFQGVSTLNGVTEPFFGFNGGATGWQFKGSVMQGVGSGLGTMALNVANGRVGLGQRAALSPVAPLHVKMTAGENGIMAQFEAGASGTTDSNRNHVGVYGYGNADAAYLVFGNNSVGTLSRNFRFGAAGTYAFGLYPQSGAPGSDAVYTPAWTFSCAAGGTGYGHIFNGTAVFNGAVTVSAGFLSNSGSTATFAGPLNVNGATAFTAGIVATNTYAAASPPTDLRNRNASNCVVSYGNIVSSTLFGGAYNFASLTTGTANCWRVNFARAVSAYTPIAMVSNDGTRSTVYCENINSTGFDVVINDVASGNVTKRNFSWVCIGQP